MKRHLMVMMVALMGLSCTGNGASGPLPLTEAQLQAIDVADEARQAMFDYLDSKGWRNHVSITKKLPQHWRAVHTTSVLEGEVNNGGHHQFFWNSDGALNAETLEDLRYIKADAFAEIFAGALEVYAKYDYEREKREAGTDWEAFSVAYEEKRLEEYDTRFYEESENQSLSRLLAKHILDNRELYLR